MKYSNREILLTSTLANVSERCMLMCDAMTNEKLQQNTMTLDITSDDMEYNGMESKLTVQANNEGR